MKQFVFLCCFQFKSLIETDLRPLTIVFRKDTFRSRFPNISKYISPRFNHIFPSMQNSEFELVVIFRAVIRRAFIWVNIFSSMTKPNCITKLDMTLNDRTTRELWVLVTHTSKSYHLLFTWCWKKAELKVPHVIFCMQAGCTVEKIATKLDSLKVAWFISVAY